MKKYCLLLVALLLPVLAHAQADPFPPYWIMNPDGSISPIGGRNVTVGNTLNTNAEFNNGTCTTALTVNPKNGNRQKVTLTNAQTCALTFTQPTTGTVSIQLKIIQSSAGSFNGLISGGKWPGGVVPTITATSGAVDIVTCYLDGTNAYCIASQNFQ